jgi:hypothetical protein
MHMTFWCLAEAQALILELEHVLSWLSVIPLFHSNPGLAGLMLAIFGIIVMSLLQLNGKSHWLSWPTTICHPPKRSKAAAGNSMVLVSTMLGAPHVLPWSLLHIRRLSGSISYVIPIFSQDILWSKI